MRDVRAPAEGNRLQGAALPTQPPWLPADPCSSSGAAPEPRGSLALPPQHSGHLPWWGSFRCPMYKSSPCCQIPACSAFTRGKAAALRSQTKCSSWTRALPVKHPPAGGTKRPVQPVRGHGSHGCSIERRRGRSPLHSAAHWDTLDFQSASQGSEEQRCYPTASSESALLP